MEKEGRGIEEGEVKEDFLSCKLHFKKYLKTFRLNKRVQRYWTNKQV